jgi:hypothetical protein
VNDDELRQLIEDYEEGRVSHDEYAYGIWAGGYDPAQMARVYCEMYGWSPWWLTASVVLAFVAGLAVAVLC